MQDIAHSQSIGVSKQVRVAARARPWSQISKQAAARANRLCCVCHTCMEITTLASIGSEEPVFLLVFNPPANLQITSHAFFHLVHVAALAQRRSPSDDLVATLSIFYGLRTRGGTLYCTIGPTVREWSLSRWKSSLL